MTAYFDKETVLHGGRFFIGPYNTLPLKKFFYESRNWFDGQKCKNNCRGIE